MRKELFKGETTMLVKKIKNNNETIKKVAKKTPWLFICGIPIGFVILFVLFPTLSEAKPYLLNLIVTLIVIAGLINIYVYCKVCFMNQRLISESFSEHKRILENIHTVYEDEPDIRAMMEVLTVGCDMKYKEDKKKVKLVVKRLLKDVE